MGQLDGKVAIITGATSGIGARTAEIFANEGAKVVLTGRRQTEGAAVAARIGSNALFIRADATEEGDWGRVVSEALSKFGRLDALFNNAGGPAPTGSITSVTVEGFDAAMGLLVRSVMLGIKHAAPIMMQQKSGSIINNGSVAAHQAGYSSSMIYGAAKAAVNHLSRCAAMELGEHNVRVNSISPGAIATGIAAKALGVEATKADAMAETLGKTFKNLQPIPRSGITDDIANCAIFLASDNSSFINGIDIIVDGGMLGGKMYSPHQEGLAKLKRVLSK